MCKYHMGVHKYLYQLCCCQSFVARQPFVVLSGFSSFFLSSCHKFFSPMSVLVLFQFNQRITSTTISVVVLVRERLFLRAFMSTNELRFELRIINFNLFINELGIIIGYVDKNMYYSLFMYIRKIILKSKYSSGQDQRVIDYIRLDKI